MKAGFSPFALGGVIVLCAAILCFAGWTFLSSDATDVSGTSDETSLETLTDERIETASLSSDDEAEGDDERARVALVSTLPQVKFEIRTANDRPLAGGALLLRRDAEVLGRMKCDASGVAQFDAADGRAELVILAKEMPPTVRDVALAAGHQVIKLERGVAVSGHVRVANQESLADIELVLVSDRPLVDASHWPENVREALELNDRSKLRLTARTNESGEFEFSGLALPWSGRVEPGEAYQLVGAKGGIWAEGSNSVRLDDPVEGLVLDLSALALARGRVVSSPGGAGVARASVNGVLNFEPGRGDDEGGTANFDGRARNDGTFSLPIHRRGGFDIDTAGSDVWPVLRSATVTIDGGDEVPRRRIELSGEKLPVGFDFGELVLEQGARLQFQAVDAQAKPLAQAIGRLDGERSEPTDEAGQSSIVYAPGTPRQLAVSLEGYREARVDVPKNVTDKLNVVLERTNRLAVFVRNPGGEPAVDVVVQLSAQRSGPQRPGGRRNRVTEQRTNAEGRVIFSDQPPATPLTVTVRDAMGTTLAEQTATLEADEWGTLELSISRPLLSFSGFVRDEQGLALAEAGLEFTDMQSPNRGNVSARSDADGRFTFSGLSSSVGLLRVRKGGFASLSLPEFQIPPPGVLADIRLERGLRLTLRVVDERGTPVRGENLRLELAGERPSMGRRVDLHEWAFSNLPRVGMIAVGSIGNREYRRDIEPLNGNQDFVVPVQGGLEVTLRLDPSRLHLTHRMTLRARDDRRVQPAQNVSAEVLQTRIFEPLLPGEYQLQVMELDGPRGNWTNLGASKRITIEPGANQRVEIER